MISADKYLYPLTAKTRYTLSEQVQKATPKKSLDEFISESVKVSRKSFTKLYEK